MNIAPIRILAVDDHPMILAGLQATLNLEPDFTVVASANDGSEAVALYRLHQPDVTLMDLRMPKMSGVEAIRAIRGEFPAARIIVLSTYKGDEDIHRAMSAGAATYLLKNMLAAKVTEVIRNVVAGGRPVMDEVAQQLTGRMFRPVLTNRELEVMHLVVRGMRNKEIAAELNISEETAQAHVKKILAKLSVQDRTEAVAVAIRRGMVHID
ncbi:MAG TPA: response regulator transcription factor [Bryobacteraceae bacterium]|nr:response regulator transcription factor [Bryobacteraceae bacterium]